MNEKFRTIAAGVALLITIGGAEGCKEKPKCETSAEGTVTCNQGPPPADGE